LVEPVVELAKGWRVSRELARRFRIYGSEFEVERRRSGRYGLGESLRRFGKLTEVFGACDRLHGRPT
jgi:hypothetical protein